jgi:hypothetical protein
MLGRRHGHDDRVDVGQELRRLAVRAAAPVAGDVHRPPGVAVVDPHEFNARHLVDDPGVDRSEASDAEHAKPQRRHVTIPRSELRTKSRNCRNSGPSGTVAAISSTASPTFRLDL